MQVLVFCVNGQSRSAAICAAILCGVVRAPAAASRGQVVAGSFDAATSRVRCAAPTLPAGSTREVWLSLNGQQFSRSGANVTWASWA